MKDQDKELNFICEQLADDFIKNLDIIDKAALESHQSTKGEFDRKVHQDDRYLVSSKPYTRKCNVINDKSVNYVWEVNYRFEYFDLFISVLRRSYIPPLLDMYQDIVISSICMHKKKDPDVKDLKQIELEAINHSYRHLVEVHRKIIDSIH